MLKEKMLRVAKAMLLVGFMVAVFVTAGCQYAAEARSGDWDAQGRCTLDGKKCHRVTLEFE